MHLDGDGFTRLSLIRKNTLLLGHLNLHRLRHGEIPNLFALVLGDVGNLGGVAGLLKLEQAEIARLNLWNFGPALTS